MKTIHRTKLEGFLRRTDGHIFSVIFIKRDKSLRKMVCRFEVFKGIKGTGQSPSHLDNSYLTVWDMQKQEFRLINLETILGGKVQHETFIVHDSQHIIDQNYIDEQTGEPQ